jgi:hypothetical protein
MSLSQAKRKVAQVAVEAQTISDNARKATGSRPRNDELIGAERRRNSMRARLAEGRPSRKGAKGARRLLRTRRRKGA